MAVTTTDPTSVVDVYRFLKLAAIRNALSPFLQRDRITENIASHDFLSIDQVFNTVKQIDPEKLSLAKHAIADFKPSLIINRISEKCRFNPNRLQTLLKDYTGRDLTILGSIPEDEAVTFLGSLLVEPKRHVPGMAELDDAEAEAIGRMITRLSRALKVREGAEHVYLFRLGHHMDHLHVWVVPRYPGTPREYWGMRVDEWPQAPRGDAEAVTALCERVRSFLHQEGI